MRRRCRYTTFQMK